MTARTDEEDVDEILGYQVKSLISGNFTERLSTGITPGDFIQIRAFLHEHHPKMRLMYSAVTGSLYIKHPCPEHERPGVFFTMVMTTFNTAVSGNIFNPLRGQGTSCNAMQAGGSCEADASFRVLNRIHPSVNIVWETNYNGLPTQEFVQKGLRYINETDDIMCAVLIQVYEITNAMIICQIHRVIGGPPAFRSLVSFGIVALTRDEVNHWTDLTGLAMSGVGRVNPVNGLPFPPCNAAGLQDYQYSISGNVLLDLGVDLNPAQQAVALNPIPALNFDLYALQMYELGI